MGRKRTIDDAKLLILIDEFFRTECMQGSKKIKLPRLTEYVQKNGFPSFRVETLRRNKVARDRIDELNKQFPIPSDLIPVYKSLDVDAFLINNQSHSSLRAALSSLDTYYRKLFEYAVEIDKKYKDAQKRILSLESEVALLKDQEGPLKKRVFMAEAEQKRLKGIVNDYVYPNIANALLAKDGDLVHAETGIDSEKLSARTITSNTKINRSEKKTVSNTVVLSLFDNFEGG